MPRPSRKKRICRVPAHRSFCVGDAVEETQHKLKMSFEEYETIRLIDYLSMSQTECAAQMGVSRATVQALYQDARRKMARFLVEGVSLLIAGGEVQVCRDSNFNCSSMQQCRDHFVNGEIGQAYQESFSPVGNGSLCQFSEKGVRKTMKLAVTYEAKTGEIFQHFGHTETFKVYEVEDGNILSSQVVDTNGTGHGALAGFLAADGVTALICGGIGGGARNALAEAGILVYPGAMGNADANVASFLKGNLAYDPNTMCSHHGEAHTCGSESGENCGHSGGEGGCHS